MSAESRNVELLQELIRVTEEGHIVWRPTARIDEFASSFQGRFSILVWKDEGDVCYLRMLDEDDRELLLISDVDFPPAPRIPSAPPRPAGELIPPAPLIPPVPSGWVAGAGNAKLVSRLFDLARRSGLKVDKTIDEILQGLKRA